MKVIRILAHAEENESYLETFLDVLLCGLGASLALLIVFSVLPKGGAGIDRTPTDNIVNGQIVGLGKGGTAKSGAATPMVLINPYRKPLALPPTGSVEPFRIFTESGRPAMRMQSFHTRAQLVGEQGFESAFRPTPFDEPLILAIHPSLVPVDDTPTDIDIVIFVGGTPASFQVTVNRDPPTREKPEVEARVSSGSFARVEGFPSLGEGFIPLFKLTTSGEIVGKK